MIHASLGDHAHTLPECNAAFDLRCLALGFSVVPGGIRIAIAVDVQRVIVGRALPGTHAGMSTGFQQRLIDRTLREIVIALHDHRVWRLRDHRALPYCLHVAPRIPMCDFLSRSKLSAANRSDAGSISSAAATCPAVN